MSKSAFVPSRRILALFTFLAGFALPVTVAAEARVSEAYGQLPLHFEANRGQTHEDVQFLARGPGYSLYLTAGEAVLVLARSNPDAKRDVHSTPERLNTQARATPVVVRMSLVGAAPKPPVSGLEELPGKANYFIGKDPAKWRTNVPTYAKVHYREAYPGIDLVYYGNQRQLEYDFVVAPGADPNRIVLGFQGAERLEIDAQGELLLHVPGGVIRQRVPVIYQEIDGVRTGIEGGYVLKGANRVGFQVAAYDASQPLVIDPTLVYSTYLGGSGGDVGRGIAVDGLGNAYVTGPTVSTDFPTTAGAFDESFNGPGFDAFVTKLNTAGSALVYSTYLGGSGFDQSFGIAVDVDGNAYVTGITESANFPTTAGAFDESYNGGFDAFVTKLGPSGAAPLVYSTYLGGSSWDQGLGIAVDGLGNAYVTGETGSANFPTTALAFDTSFNGDFDAFVTKLGPSGAAPLLYSTYLGGSGREHGSAIAVDAAGNAYVTGATSGNFPTTAGAFDTSFNGFVDAFVTKLGPSGAAPLLYSTYLGGSDSDQGSGIAVDGDGNAYVTGSTFSANFPTTAGAFDQSYNGLFDAFVTKLGPGGAAPLLYSTYLGGSGFDQGLGIAVDGLGNAYVTGLTNSANFPTTPLAFDPIFNGGIDAFVTKLGPSGAAPLLYSTYLGGSGGDRGLGIAVDGDGNAYVTGLTNSVNFPTTALAFDITYNGGIDAFVTKLDLGPLLLVPFAAFSAEVEITRGPLVLDDRLEVRGMFTLGAASNGIDPPNEAVSLKAGTYGRTIPPGCFTQPQPGLFKCEELLGLEVVFRAIIDASTYTFTWEDKRAEATGTMNPVEVTLIIGDDGGTTTDDAELTGP